MRCATAAHSLVGASTAGPTRSHVVARRPKAAIAVAPKQPLSPDWRNDGRWRITAMLAKIPQDEYLSEAREFENHHICHQTVSDDWLKQWHDWCFGKLVGRPVAAASIETKPKRQNLFA